MIALRSTFFHVPFVVSDEENAPVFIGSFIEPNKHVFVNNSSFSSVVERKVSPEHCPTSKEVKANTAIDCSNATNLQVNRLVAQISPLLTTV